MNAAALRAFIGAEPNAEAITNVFKARVLSLSPDEWEDDHVGDALWHALEIRVEVLGLPDVPDTFANREVLGELPARMFDEYQNVFFGVKCVVVEIALTIAEDATINTRKLSPIAD